MGRLVASRWSQTFETRASKDAATERSFRSETSTSRAAVAAAKPLGDALICSSAGHIQTVSDVKVVEPIDSCCNCGSESGIELYQTDMRRMPLLGLAGVEIKVSLPFPYCRVCSSSAKRRRPTLLGILASSALLAIVIGMAWMFLGPTLSGDNAVAVVGVGIVAISLLIVLGFFFLRRPAGDQTSYYQPVILKKTGHKWPADITGLELAFTNPEYAKKFVLANESVIADGKLKISSS